MKLLTQKQLILGIMEAWEQQYLPAARKLHPWTRKILKSLKCLDLATTTAEDIAGLTGNYSWTDIVCNECGLYIESAVCFGEDLGFDSVTAVVCFACLKKALALEPES